MNTQVPVQSIAQTMSTRELSILCGKQHKHVCRDAEKLNETYVKMGLPKIGQGYYTHPNTGNQQHREFLLTKDQTIDLVTGYNSELRIKINRRWAELEKQTAFDIKNPVHLLQAIEVQARLNLELSEKVAHLEPKAEALDVIADTSNTYCLRECAKTIGIQEKELIQLLIDKKWIYREPSKTLGKSGKLQPHAQYVLNKVFINRISPVITNQYTGQEMVHTHMRVTAFGLTRITGLVNKIRKEKKVA
ncbi:phage antirepressor KilAC domain-containing protein [Acinetobacter sp. BSP-28]|uniref:phage antirepressor KilAC domain-containing protein n=1 Tax=Acinetobacter sp. BSP-28 TaxID=3344661 RepID=UPI00376FEF82